MLMVADTEPQMTDVTPKHGPTTGAFSVSLLGYNFGQFDTSPAIRFGDTHCEGSTWFSDTTIVCKMSSVWWCVPAAASSRAAGSRRGAGHRLLAVRVGAAPGVRRGEGAPRSRGCRVQRSQV